MEPTVCPGSAACVSNVLVLRSHVLPDSMVTNPPLLPIFPLYLVSSGRDYSGLETLPEADMHSFIKNPNVAHTLRFRQSAPIRSEDTHDPHAFNSFMLCEDCCLVFAVIT